MKIWEVEITRTVVYKTQAIAWEADGAAEKVEEQLEEGLPPDKCIASEETKITTVKRVR